MPDFRIVQTTEKPYLYVTRTCSMAPEDVSSNMGSAFQEVWGFMQGKSIAPAGGALSVYYDYNPDRMTFRAGFTIARQDMAKADGNVKADVTPAGGAVYFQHKGPYSTLADDYGKMMKYLADQGREMAVPTWEVYLNDPDKVGEQDLLTDVFTSVK